MKIIQTKLQGVIIIEPQVFADTRGFFLETWNQSRYAEAGLPSNFVQDNLSHSTKGVLRGLHYQKHSDSQGKLVYALQGEIWDVAVDIRVGSPTFRQWVGVVLSSENKRQVYIPEGFAHGFYVTSESALCAYKCTKPFNAQAEGGIIWNDPDLNINWPSTALKLSAKDQHYPRLCDIEPRFLPQYPEQQNSLL